MPGTVLPCLRCTSRHRSVVLNMRSGERVRRFSCLTGFGAPMPGIGMVPTYIGVGYSSVAPSRFGYFGTALPRNATPADQADAYLYLLDHLQIDRAVAVGYSAGSASAIQLALRHPDRLHALILIAAHLPGLPARRVIQPMMRAAFRWERMFWALKSVMPQAFNRLTGVPKGWAPTAAEEKTIHEVAESISPSNRDTAGQPSTL